jgi:hypothetical protein
MPDWFGAIFLVGIAAAWVHNLYARHEIARAVKSINDVEVALSPEMKAYYDALTQRQLDITRKAYEDSHSSDECLPAGGLFHFTHIWDPGTNLCLRCKARRPSFRQGGIITSGYIQPGAITSSVIRQEQIRPSLPFADGNPTHWGADVTGAVKDDD